MKFMEIEIINKMGGLKIKIFNRQVCGCITNLQILKGV